jgi:hypothetical protein
MGINGLAQLYAALNITSSIFFILSQYTFNGKNSPEVFGDCKGDRKGCASKSPGYPSPPHRRMGDSAESVKTALFIPDFFHFGGNLH